MLLMMVDTLLSRPRTIMEIIHDALATEVLLMSLKQAPSRRLRSKYSKHNVSLMSQIQHQRR